MDEPSPFFGGEEGRPGAFVSSNVLVERSCCHESARSLRWEIMKGNPAAEERPGDDVRLRFGLRLQRVQVVNGLGGMRSGRKDRSLVVLQDLEPASDIGGVILTNLRRD